MRVRNLSWVLYGVRRRYPSGPYIKDAFDDIDEDEFKRSLPQSDLDRAIAEALREAFDTRPAAPPSSGAPMLTPEQEKLAELLSPLPRAALWRHLGSPTCRRARLSTQSSPAGRRLQLLRQCYR